VKELRIVYQTLRGPYGLSQVHFFLGGKYVTYKYILFRKA